MTSEYVPLPHCRHRATESNGKGFRACSHCGGITETREAYWASGIYDENDYEPRLEFEEEPA